MIGLIFWTFVDWVGIPFAWQGNLFDMPVCLY